MLKNRHHLAAEPPDERGDLVMGQAVGGQVRHGMVEIAIRDPDPAQFADGLDRRLGHSRHRFRLAAKGLLEMTAETIRDQPRLGRADALDVWMIGEEAGKPLGIEVEIVAQELGLKLAAVLGMHDPAALESYRVILTDIDFARKLHLIAIGRDQAAGAERGPRIEDHVDDAPDRLALFVHRPHLFHAASR